MTAAPLLSVRDLSVAFGTGSRQTLAVDRVSFDIAPGETVALVGESGSGKSVTALSVLKLLPYPSAHHPSGSISFKGRDLLPLSEREMRRVRGDDITIVFQEPMTSLNPLHTIETQIGEILLLHRGLTGAAARRRTLEVLTQVGIPDPETRLGSYPHQLSGGQRQRVMIAMALACEPDLIIADEPTTALDVSIQAQIMRVIRRASEAHDAAVLLISHNIGLVSQSCDRVIIMYAGTLVEELAVADLMSAASHPYTKALISAIPAIGRPRELALEQVPGEPADASAAPSGCPYHPRCPLAVARCSSEVPELLRIASGAHRVACHVVNEAPDA